MPKEFPADATDLQAGAIKDKLAGTVYAATLADGNRWRLQFRANGYFFINTSSGFSGTGEWRADEGKLCTHLRGDKTACNEVRQLGTAVYLKRDSGEVIAMTPQ